MVGTGFYVGWLFLPAALLVTDCARLLSAQATDG